MVPPVKHLLGRKFLVAVITIVAATGLAFAGKLTSEFATIASIVNGAFNAADTFITRKALGAGATGRNEQGEI
jgi:hypothetical protein